MFIAEVGWLRAVLDTETSTSLYSYTRAVKFEHYYFSLGVIVDEMVKGRGSHVIVP